MCNWQSHLFQWGQLKDLFGFVLAGKVSLPLVTASRATPVPDAPPPMMSKSYSFSFKKVLVWSRVGMLLLSGKASSASPSAHLYMSVTDSFSTFVWRSRHHPTVLHQPITPQVILTWVSSFWVSVSIARAWSNRNFLEDVRTEVTGSISEKVSAY